LEAAMHSIIEGQRDRIADLCRRYSVRRLDVFGSAAGDAFDPARSDVDIVVEFAPLPEGAYADAWFGLHEALEELFGRPVDLVSTTAIHNPYFRAALERTRRTLYAA
jgi:predicted nucleotidyltransferase